MIKFNNISSLLSHLQNELIASTVINVYDQLDQLEYFLDGI